MSQLIAFLCDSRASESRSPLLTPATSRSRRSWAVAGATSGHAGYSSSRVSTRARASANGWPPALTIAARGITDKFAVRTPGRIAIDDGRHLLFQVLCPRSVQRDGINDASGSAQTLGCVRPRGVLIDQGPDNVEHDCINVTCNHWRSRHNLHSNRLVRQTAARSDGLVLAPLG
jgi:hypothetical protein